MSVLTVTDLKKEYPSFALKGVSFSLEKGKITGFIGRNGAGKSTTLNSLLDFVHPDSGEIVFFGMDFAKNENEIKQRIGFVASGANYYPKKKLKKISAVTKSFYTNWDDAAYEKYMRLFHLDENKTPCELSSGMKVKYALALALSHNADLLVLDEPTSGLDPVSRDDLLDIFIKLCEEGKTILFSTHITSDLDKCAHNIIYIKNGEIIADTTIDEFENCYKVVSFGTRQEIEPYSDFILGYKKNREGYTALIKTENIGQIDKKTADADLESIMVHIEKEAQ